METAHRYLSHNILFSRDDFYKSIYLEYLSRIGGLKEQYGGWKKIRGKIRREQFKNMRRSGFIYEPGKGWIGPNSVALSSL